MTNSSLQERLRAARKQGQNRQTRDFPIPGYGGRLWATFRALDDYGDVRRIVAEHAEIADQVQQELYIAADTIVLACQTTYALEGDTRHPLEMSIGSALAAYLDDEIQVENDRQGVFHVFPNTLAVMALYGELDQWFKSAGAGSDRDIAGNSDAPSK